MNIFAVRGNFAAVRYMTVHARRVELLEFSATQSAGLILNSNDTMRTVSEAHEN
jgi:hypothetical protein